MEITETKKNNFTVVELNGRLDTTHSGLLEKKLQVLFAADEKNIVVDCSGMEYVSSTGLRVFLMFLKKANSVKGKFYLCSLRDNIKEIFDISGFTSLFHIFATQDEAVEN